MTPLPAACNQLSLGGAGISHLAMQCTAIVRTGVPLALIRSALK